MAKATNVSMGIVMRAVLPMDVVMDMVVWWTRMVTFMTVISRKDFPKVRVCS